MLRLKNSGRLLCMAGIAGALLLGSPASKGLKAKASVEKQVETLISASPSVRRGHFGFQVADVETGEVLAAKGAREFFIPASNTKLFTTAAALVRLGPSYRFRTEVRAVGRWSAGQPVVTGLELVGGGDPNLSGRTLPYSSSVEATDPLAAINNLADQVMAAGIREVRGDVVSIDSRYPGDVYPDGWTIDDQLWSYGAPVSSLAVNDNSLSVTIRPTELGALADIEVSPEVGHFVVLNGVVTVPGGREHIEFARDLGSRELVIWGEIGETAQVRHEDLAVEDAGLFASQALREALRNRGIAVRGEARVVRRDLDTVPDPKRGWHENPASGAVVAQRLSAPLSQILQLINKISQNLHTEMVLREIGWVERGVGTLQAGVLERQIFLAEAGVTPDDSGFVLDDGSGLARQDLTTPESTVTLLRYMWRRPEREVWLATLPIGGVDGSLEHRLKGLAGAERVHAKTGSISHVNSLAGYIETRNHRWLAFSMVVNATTSRGGDVRDFLDKLCGIFLED
jgi:serine-type D-Ala-D-Ala carboxypeptidase/endopeptidase (penicillin-binding protein 4)